MNIFLICGRWQFSQGLNLEILHRTVSWEAQEEKEEEVNLQIIWSLGSNPAAVPSIKAGGGEAFGSLAPGSQPWFSFKLSQCFHFRCIVVLLSSCS